MSIVETSTATAYPGRWHLCVKAAIHMAHRPKFPTGNFSSSPTTDGKDHNWWNKIISIQWRFSLLAPFQTVEQECNPLLHLSIQLLEVFVQDTKESLPGSLHWLFLFSLFTMSSFRFYSNASHPGFLHIMIINNSHNNIVVIHMEIQMWTAFHINKMRVF